MDIQSLFDSMNDLSRRERSKYHVTVGSAIDTLITMNPDAPVLYADGAAPGEALSYRGHYSDLAFADETTDTVTVKLLLDTLLAVWNTELTGYKGGEFLMDRDTPIWRSEYGIASNIAWTDLAVQDHSVIIKTRQINC